MRSNNLEAYKFFKGATNHLQYNTGKSEKCIMASDIFMEYIARSILKISIKSMQTGKKYVLRDLISLCSGSSQWSIL